ncbi:putative cystine transporter YijE [Usitatibacter rugosus]|uniref:Putative cystine transporter YijE n=1 Tax=Usitatibacter rugosus TaxID=2732067 RepID=A0A6M4GRC2_9PROT|nr:putative cystine transporter YijE [Usitatibacter rugosus]
MAALVAMVLIWGYSWVVMKIALRHAHPFDFAAWRVGLGSAFLFLLVKLTGRKLLLPRYRMAVLLGCTQVALFVALSHFALLKAGPGKTSVLVFTMPFWMIVFAHFLIGERMRGTQWIAVAIAFAGLTLIVAPWDLTSVYGSLLAVAGGAVWAISAVMSKRWPTPGTDPLTFTAWQLLFGAIVLAALAATTSDRPIEWTHEYIYALAFSTIAATAIGWWLWTYILQNTPAGIAGLNSLGIPVVAVMSSWVQLGERPPGLELAGMLLIGFALALLAWLNLRNAART